MDKELIAGRNTVLEALRSKREINKIWIADGAQKGSMTPIIKEAKKANILVQFVPKQKIDQLE